MKLRLPDQARLIRIQSGTDRDPAAVALRLASNMGTPAYRAAVGVRNRMYDLHLLRSRPLGRPTVAVGNLTAGGTGKTPMVIELCHRLRVMGHRPAVLLRGYEPAGLESKEGSDEAKVLRGALGSIPVQADSSRVRGARAVLAAHPDTGVFVLDDAFQHRKARRDLDLVLIDATRPFGFGRLLPRGLLREPLRSLRRADAVIITRADRVDGATLEKLDRRITRVTGRAPIAHAVHHWAELRIGHEARDVAWLSSHAVLGVSGIGNPADFEAKLRGAAGRVVGMVTFDDHHAYTRSEVQGILNHAEERGAEAVVTTQKDWVKWRRLAGGTKARLPVVRPIVRMAFLDGGDALDEMLREAVGSRQ